MKFITNLILATVLIIYVFLPIFNLGVLGNLTGYGFTEQTINISFTLKKIFFSILPFIACFGAILFNCMKSRFSPLISLLFIGLGLYFYYTLKCAGLDGIEILKVTGYGVGFNINIWLLWAAVISSLISLLPFSFNKHYEQKKKDK